MRYLWMIPLVHRPEGTSLPRYRIPPRAGPWTSPRRPPDDEEHDGLDRTPESGQHAAGGPRAGYVFLTPGSTVGPVRWLDLRLVTGLLLVLGSVVLGTRVIAAADDTVPVLVAATDLAPGQSLTTTMVETRQVGLAESLEGLYHTGQVGDGYVVVRLVSAGELLPRSAVAVVTDTALSATSPWRSW